MGCVMILLTSCNRSSCVTVFGAHTVSLHIFVTAQVKVLSVPYETDECQKHSCIGGQEDGRLENVEDGMSHDIAWMSASEQI